MIKILIGGAVLLACFYLGIGLDRYYRIRKELLEEYVEFLQYAEREIKYLKREVGEIVANFPNGKKSAFGAFLRSYATSLKEGVEWKAESPYLNDNDKRSIENALKALKSMDYLNCQQVLANAVAEGERMREKARKAKKEKGELYRKLAVLIGVGFLILIV